MSHRRVKSPAAANAISGKTAPLLRPCPAPSVPAWHNGFKRKARTPRRHHKPAVPELESSADEEEEEEQQLLYRVPVFDPALAFSDPSPPPATPTPSQAVSVGEPGRAEFAPTELEIAEFAADMESLLGQGLAGGESFSLEDLGLMEERESGASGEVAPAVKGEMEEDWKHGPGLRFEMEVDISRETLDLDFGGGLPEMVAGAVAPEAEEEEGVTSGVGLRLNYESVMTAWMARGRSPWISSGKRPWMGTEECWLACMGMRGGEMGRGITPMSVGREARVTRYREKRRTRLFSKKIRYEVRKLNAEKRPRMKGRFVKRSSFTSTAPTISETMT
ncbi:Zinc finger protein CONSTANS-LIKE 16 [Platanthera zijinensis]|uniref:Zinc finger protein CONSTANS-LIKE 16 n=1 Tax=Platanthera zijinensis TaxID=2320716 RepID=A0AAP0B7Z4_9ASPA